MIKNSPGWVKKVIQATGDDHIHIQEQRSASQAVQGLR
jgi:hypothetical protein